MTVTVDDLKPIGQELNRPESVLATASGDLYTSNADGGVSHLHPDRSHSRYLGKTAGPRTSAGAAVSPRSGRSRRWPSPARSAGRSCSDRCATRT